MLVLWATGKSTFSSKWSLFMPLFILSVLSLFTIPVLGYLSFKNHYWKNKVMNLSLIGAIIAWFVFTFYFLSFFGGNASSHTGTITTLILSISLVTVYALFKNQMQKLYYNLIAVLYIENDYRISKYSYRPINMLNNFVDL